MSFLNIGITKPDFISPFSFNAMYGGVQVSLAQEGVQDSFSNFVYDPLRLQDSYNDVQGTIPLIIEGPTFSGIVSILSRLDRFSKSVDLYEEGLEQDPIYLYADTNEKFLARLKQLKVNMDSNISEFERLKKGKISLEYTRAGVCGIFSLPSQYPASGLVNRAHLLRGVAPSGFTNYPVPTDVEINFFSQSGIFPSGYLLFGETTFIGARSFEDISFDPPQITFEFDLDRWPWAGSAGGTTLNGTDRSVLRFTPTNTNIIRTGGAAFLSPLPYTTSELDVYATVRTTQSGISYNIRAINNPGVASQAVFESLTDFYTIPPTLNPKTYYIGRLSSSALINRLRLSLELQAPVASGSLFIDKIVVHDVTSIGSNSLYIHGRSVVGPFSETTTSGTLVIDSGYFPNSTSDGFVYSDPAVYYRINNNSLPLTYFGNPLIFSVPSGISQVVKCAFIAEGSTFGTASGLRMWQWMDTTNRPTQLQARISRFQYASPLFTSDLV